MKLQRKPDKSFRRTVNIDGIKEGLTKRNI